VAFALVLALAVLSLAGALVLALPVPRPVLWRVLFGGGLDKNSILI
jgi:hypothetical protein